MSPENRRIDGLLELTKKYGCSQVGENLVKVSVLDRDDCAVLTHDQIHDLVIGSDFVRGEGFSLFRSGHLSRKDLGYYLVGANVSDIAAMGASPLGVLTAIRYTSELTDDQFLEIMEGVCMACADMKCPLLGGDTGGYHASVLSAAAIGLVPRDRALLRRNARPGDAIVVSGTIGTAGAAFEMCNAGLIQTMNRDDPLLADLLKPWRRVAPAIKHGQLLTQANLSSCGMDTSDGLKTSCQSIASASGVDIVLEAELLPIGTEVKLAASLLGRDVFSLACSDSVDFRLLFTVRQSNISRFRDVFSESNLDYHVIGSVEPVGSTNLPTVRLRRDGRLDVLSAIEKVQ